MSRKKNLKLSKRSKNKRGKRGKLSKRNKRSKRGKLSKRSKRGKRRSSCRRNRRVSRKRKKSRGHRVQMGCAKQKGGSSDLNYNCNYPRNMGSIITGTKNNLQCSDLVPETTQNRIPQKGGGIIGFDGFGTSKMVDFGLSNLLTTAREGVNGIVNVKSTWNADRRVASADPVVSHKMDNS